MGIQANYNILTIQQFCFSVSNGKKRKVDIPLPKYDRDGFFLSIQTASYNLTLHTHLDKPLYQITY